MSKCISSHGEYSEHELDGHGLTCMLCGVFDEDAAVARIEALERENRELQAAFEDADAHAKVNAMNMADYMDAMERAKAAEAALATPVPVADEREALIEEAFEVVCTNEPLSHITRSDIRQWVDLFEGLGFRRAEPVTPETDGWPEMYASAIEYALERLGVTDDHLPPDIAECPEGCEAEMGLKHLIWHLAERAVTPETETEWADPEPWLYLRSGKRAAHPLPHTWYVKRPRTRAQYEAEEGSE